ncbi:hypothetical protein NIES2101_17915, partial [Calothrix sp. HK-06]
YNAERLSKSAPYEVSVNSKKVTGKQIQEWMQICIEALKQYPKSILPKFSLEALQSTGFEVQSESIRGTEELEWQNELAREEISDSEFYLSGKINSILSENLITLKPDVQKILFLYYGFKLTQKQLADTLNINQSTLSRYIAKSTLNLLDNILEISQPKKWADDYVKRWLKQSYQAPIHSDIIQASLVDAVKKLSMEERDILQGYYNQQINYSCTKVNKIICDLQNELLLNINNWVKKYINRWLTNYYNNLVVTILDNSHYSRDSLEIETIVSLVETYLKSATTAIVK